MASAEQYELLELAHRDVAETWLAKEKDSGRRLLFHRYPKKSGLRERIVTMAPADLIMLVGAGEEGDSYIAVSHDVPVLRRFREWVEKRSEQPTQIKPGGPGISDSKPTAASDAAADFDPAKTVRLRRSEDAGDLTGMFSPPPLRNEANPLVARTAVLPNEPNPAPGAQEPGEFTRMFSAPAVRNEPNSAPASADIPVLRNEASSAPAAQEPGEFTRMFSAPARNELSRSDPGSAPVLRNEPIVAPAAREPGEFTRMFSAPAVRNEPNPPAASTGTQPGEFTKLFNSMPATSLGEELEAPSQKEALKTPPRSASEFTEMFGTAEDQKPPLESPMRYSGGGQVGATGIFSSPKATGGAMQPSLPSGPSEYTRLFQAPSAGDAAGETAAATSRAEKQLDPDAKAQQATKLWPLVIVLVGIVLLAIALTAYFLLKR